MLDEPEEHLEPARIDDHRVRFEIGGEFSQTQGDVVAAFVVVAVHECKQGLDAHLDDGRLVTERGQQVAHTSRCLATHLQAVVTLWEGERY